MVEIKDVDEIVGELCGECRVAVGHMGDKIDQVSKGNDAGIRRRCWGS